MPWTDFKSKLVKVVNDYDTIQINRIGSLACIRTCTKVTPDATKDIVKNCKKSPLKLLLNDIHWYLKNYHISSKLLEIVSKYLFSGLYCYTWDRFEQLRHTSPFTNMEYGVPEDKIDLALEYLS